MGFLKPKTSCKTSCFFLNDAMFRRCFWKNIDVDVFDDVLQNAKHRANDASNDVNPPPLCVWLLFWYNFSQLARPILEVGVVQKDVRTYIQLCGCASSGPFYACQSSSGGLEGTLRTLSQTFATAGCYTHFHCQPAFEDAQCLDSDILAFQIDIKNPMKNSLP